jgi:hypothetical protein
LSSVDDEERTAYKQFAVSIGFLTVKRFFSINSIVIFPLKSDFLIEKNSGIFIFASDASLSRPDFVCEEKEFLPGINDASIVFVNSSGCSK